MRQLTGQELENINAGGLASGYCAGFAGVMSAAALAALNPAVAAAMATAATNPAVLIWAFGSATFCAGYMDGWW